MATQQQFLDLLQDIEPSTTTVDACSSAHRTLRSLIAAHDTFQDIHVDTFLSGSYARNTALRPRTVDGREQRPDVDIIVVTNYSPYDDPADVVETVYKAVKQCGYKDVTKNRRSVNVKLATAEMDVVPVTENPYGDGYLIPDRELARWLNTNPTGHTEWGTEVNKKSGGMFKRQVKLLKWWRRENLATLRRPGGFILECLVAKHMDYHETSYEEAFAKLLERITTEYSLNAELGFVPTLEDPAVPGNNVFSNVKPDEFKRFYDKLAAHAKLVRLAQQETDQDEALEFWRKIFGPRFPATASARNSLLRNAAAAGLTFPPKPVLPNKPQGFA